MSTPDILVNSSANVSSTTPGPVVPHAEGYERSDIKIYVVLTFLVALGVSLAVMEFGLWELLTWFRRDAAHHQAPQTPLVSKTMPPEPRLQRQPWIDYSRFAASQSAQLESYGWIDRPQNLVRTPISTAIDSIVEHGLPKFGTPQTTPVDKLDATGKTPPVKK